MSDYLTMRPKASSEWQQVVKHVMGLWPELHKKHWSKMINDVWLQRLGHHDLDLVLSELKHTASESSFFPKAGDLHRKIEARSKERRPQQVQENDDLPDWETIQAEWRTIKARVSAISDEDREQHKQTLLQQDWRLGWMAHQHSMSKGWLAQIHRRIQAGLQPDEPDPNLQVPERYEGPGGNLGVADLL